MYQTMSSSSEMLCGILKDEKRNSQQTYYQNNKEEIKQKRRIRYIRQKADGMYKKNLKHQCHCCDQSFTTSSSLNKHMLTKKHHNNLIIQMTKWDCFS